MADQEAKDKVFGQNLLDDSHSGVWKTQDSSGKIEKKKELMANPKKLCT